MSASVATPTATSAAVLPGDRPAELGAAPATAMADELVTELAGRGIELWFEGERLRFRAPKGVLTADDRARLAAAKTDVLAALRARAAEAPPERQALSYGQRALWVLHLRAPDSAAYHVAMSVRIVTPVPAAALAQAAQALVDRHAILRTTYTVHEGEPVQQVAGWAAAHLTMHDAAALDESALREAALAEYHRPFDLAHGPLARFVVWRCANGEQVLLLTVHHIAADGWTLLLLMEELARLVTEATQGTPAGLERPVVTYAEYARAHEQMLAGPEGERLWNFWRGQLAAPPTPLQWPSDRPRPPQQSFRGATYEFHIEPGLYAALTQLARREGTTPFVLTLTAFQVLLHRLTGADDLIVGTPAFGRGKADYMRVAGDFVNSVPVRARIDGRMPFRELLGAVRQTMFGVLDAQEFPLPLMVQRAGVERDAARSPLFDAMFMLQRFERFKAYEALLAGPADAPAVEVGGLQMRPYLLPQQEGQFDLTMGLVEAGAAPNVALSGAVKYATDLFDAGTIARWAQHYVTLLRGIVADAATPVGALPLLAAADEERLVRTLNRSAAPYPTHATVHGLFEAQVARVPHATAVLFEEQRVSYAGLNAEANRLAHTLLARGVQPGARVGIRLERSVTLVAAVLAVQKAGAAYVPLDPAFPGERIEFMMRDAGLAAVITQQSLASAGPQGAHTTAPGAPAAVFVDAEAAAIAAMPAHNPGLPGAPGDLLNVIYTSGSTGRPKGVLLEHGAAVNLLTSIQQQQGLTERDRFVAVTTLSFDIAGLELHGPLTCGGTVVLASRLAGLDFRALAALVQRHDATVLQATPATWRLLLEQGWRGHPGIKMFTGGEALERDLAEQLLALPGELWNLYGPTETTIYSTGVRINDLPRPLPVAMPIGQPIANTQVYVLEFPEGLPPRLAPPGVLGELCIGGTGLARGYLGQPELTAERFLTVTLPLVGPVRLYRTGDIVRWRADGLLEYTGRRDHQVKLRGFRIELGEIEATLATHPGVKRAVALVREDVPGDKRLVAYVVTDPVADDGFSPEAARATLRRTLPEYMVPNFFVRLPVLPISPNGKVDRKALPPPLPAQPAAPLGEPGSAKVVMNATEQKVAAAWRALLGSAAVGLDDNFFDLGGHSLLLVKLQLRLQEAFGTALPLVELFQRTTVRQQAARLQSATGAAGASANGAPSTIGASGAPRALGNVPAGPHAPGAAAPGSAQSALQRARERAEKLKRGSSHA